MNPILLAVDDGIAQGEYNMADAAFIVALCLAALAGIAYAAGFVGTVDADGHRPYARFHQWAAALVAFAVAAIAFGLFAL